MFDDLFDIAAELLSGNPYLPKAIWVPSTPNFERSCVTVGQIIPIFASDRVSDSINLGEKLHGDTIKRLWSNLQGLCKAIARIILCMDSANERRRYNVTSSLIVWAHTQDDPYNGQFVVYKFYKSNNKRQLRMAFFVIYCTTCQDQINIHQHIMHAVSGIPCFVFSS